MTDDDPREGVEQNLKNILPSISGHHSESAPPAKGKTRENRDFSSTCVESITADEVLARLKAAFAADDWTGPRRPGGHLADEPHRPHEFFRDDDSPGGYAVDGFRFYKAPTRNRRTAWKPLKTPSKHLRPADDAEATRLLLAAEPQHGKTTFDLDKLVERCRRKVLTRIRVEPSYWARLCAAYERLAGEEIDRNADERAQEALDWIVEVEDDPALERARQIVMCWLRSRKAQRAFAASRGICRVELRRLVEKYCTAVADRLNAGPRALAADIRPVNNGTIATGVGEIAAITRRTPASTLKLIQGGKAPIATLAGEPTALVELIDIGRFRSRAQPDSVRQSRWRLRTDVTRWSQVAA